MINKKNKSERDILWFDEIGKEDLPFVGGKGANLGEMTKMGAAVPPGFVVTAKAYFEFLEENQLEKPIQEILTSIREDDPQSFQEVSFKIKKLIEHGKVPKEIASQIMRAYLSLGKGIKQVLVAVRSSATAEDLPTASFAGQQITYLNVKGEANVVDRVRACWASLFEPRAIFYRQENKFDHFKTGIAVPVQEMIQSEISGVMFTTDPITGEKNKILIEAIFGLGELIVQGEIIPDRYLVDRQKMKIISKDIAEQSVQLIKVGNLTKRTNVAIKLRKKQKLTDKKIIDLAEIGRKIHQHYYFPQDIEWAQSKGKLYLLQTRPITTLDKNSNIKNQKVLKINLPLILKGEPASPGIGSGPAKVIRSAREISKVEKGDVLVTTMTTPDFVPAMKKVVAIVTDLGGQTSHAAIVSRELGIPCVVGTQEATKKIHRGQEVTVNGKSGEIFNGFWKGEKKKNGAEFPVAGSGVVIKTATRLYVNLGEPQKAAQVAALNVDGVGLLRAEFMLAQMGVHPKKFIAEKKQRIFVDKLTEGLKIFCQAFDPRPVVYRATDFKTNEYRRLTGGIKFEPQEENPLIGYRGAFRYVADSEVFEMELEAIKRIRNKCGFKNLHLMIPFVRTPKELVSVKRIIWAKGLSRSSLFKLWLMVEIPANVILLDKFIDAGIDGVSIGSNDLTMLILGVDRDNALLKEAFDERDPAVLWAIKRTIRKCLRRGITVSICGQAPSFYADLVEKLVAWGITSISVSPDSIDLTRGLIYSAEDKLLNIRR